MAGNISEMPVKLDNIGSENDFVLYVKLWHEN